VIEPQVEVLLEALERFEAIRRKFARMGEKLVDLSYANPYGGIQEAARAVLREALESERLLSLQYAPFGGQTFSRRAVADSLRRTHHLDFNFEDVILTPGAMGALQLALHASGRRGHEVIIVYPCWLDYPLYASSLDLIPIMVPLAPPAFDIDVAAIARALNERTCAIVLSHPANPTGRNYGRPALEQLAETIRSAESRLGSTVTIIADETHRDFVPDGEYWSLASVYDRALVVYSFGKYHFMQGQRLGYVATSPRHPTRHETAAELVRWTRITGLATPTALMQRALPSLLTLRHEQGWLAHWRRRLVDELTSAGHDVVEPQATMFVYVRTPPGYDDFDFVERLARSGVLVLPAPVFHHTGYFRIALTGSESMLEKALPVLASFAP
jgi:aspartate aminotransferase